MKNWRPHAILLDFYGTVVEDDDTPIGKICDQISMASPIKVTSSEVGSYWGDVFYQLCSESFGTTFRPQRELELVSLQHILQHFKVDLDSQILSQVLYKYWIHPRIFPESKDVVTQCEIPICLVSNIDNADVQSALRHNSLRFQWVVTSEDCMSYKPRKEMFEKALFLVGLRAQEVLHVGDSRRGDIHGAKSMKIPVLWINRKGRSVSSGDIAPDFVANDLTGLLNILSGK